MRSDARKLLYDMAAAAAAIREFCARRTPTDYETDLMLRSACERQFEIIGEAMSRLRDRHRDVFDRIESGPAIIAFRNRLIHGYDTVDTRIVWEVIQDKLLPLERVSERLMAELDGSQ